MCNFVCRLRMLHNEAAAALCSSDGRQWRHCRRRFDTLTYIRRRKHTSTLARKIVTRNARPSRHKFAPFPWCVCTRWRTSNFQQLFSHHSDWERDIIQFRFFENRATPVTTTPVAESACEHIPLGISFGARSFSQTATPQCAKTQTHARRITYRKKTFANEKDESEYE